ncbi:hypothetical protein H0H93_015710 [Arthromyces matolae]|nr:hypothetical protein H0H93_015710 [Arthromyces matolae]
MEFAAVKLLESATHRTLHAQAFSRSSSQASLVLTDLLSRYLALLTSTCAKYATHAGRTNITVHDALGALGELGVGIDELREYAGSEGKELGRYAIWSARRVEDLVELKAQLKDGTKMDRDDIIPLIYAPYLEVETDSDEEEEEECGEEENFIRIRSFHDMDDQRISPPPSKRPRTTNWQSPDHIPDFLPPFPALTPAETPDPTPARDVPQPAFEPPPPVTSTGVNPPAAALTATSASDYLMQVPYEQSSLAQVGEWHLPSQRSHDAHAHTTLIETEPALVKAYHHILTHPPLAQVPQPTLSRYKVSMGLLKLLETAPRWDVADTLYGSVAPNTPKVPSIGPTYPIPVGDNNAQEKFPPTLPRAVNAAERIAPMASQQGSRIHELARSVLPPPIVSRVSRLTHPPPLQRGTKLLVYGGGVPAPWNANALPAGDVKDKEDPEGKTNKAALSDARLFATWEVETKDFRSTCSMFTATSLAEISRNTSVISSSSSSSSTSDLNERPVRPARLFAAPRSASDNVRQLPGYISRELGVETESVPSARPRFNSPRDFEFGEILGHGSYSTVIKAQGKKSGRAYAIKVLDKAHLQRHNQRRTAYAEKEALVVLGTSHSGIVGLHSTFSDAWSLYFVLDLLPNGDLRALIVRYGSLSLACTRYYIAQLVDAIAYIHSKGVMHRDIKPENLLLDSCFRLALADFGTAKVLGVNDSKNDKDGAPYSNTFVGTPQYYSPELLSNSHTYPSSDLWALGCVLFELHTGIFAFNGPSPLITWRLIKDLSYTIPDGFDTDAADLVRHLLLVDPAERLGAGKDGNDMLALRNHPFFDTVDWDTIWKGAHPPLESGLKEPPEPVTPLQSDAELSAQLREERMQEEDDDEIAWAKDARIAAYLPGLRHVNGDGALLVAPNGEYRFPRVEVDGHEDASISYDALNALDLAREIAPTSVVEAEAERALDRPLNVDVVEDDMVLNGAGTPAPLVPFSTPLENTTPAETTISRQTPPELFTALDISSSYPRFSHLLRKKESLILSTQLLPEASAPGGLVKLLPRLLSGSLRGKKPKLKERALLLTDQRILCVSTGSKSLPTLKAEYSLAKNAGLHISGVQTSGNDGILILTGDKGVVYTFHEVGAQERWIQNIRPLLNSLR